MNWPSASRTSSEQAGARDIAPRDDPGKSSPKESKGHAALARQSKMTFQGVLTCVTPEDTAA